MAQLLDTPPVVRERDVTPPAVLPERLESPTSSLLPRTVAGRQRLSPGWIVPGSRTDGHQHHWDWAEIGMIALTLACAALAIYRLGWAIQS